MNSRTPSDLFSGVYRYWSARRGGRPMPSRADLNPADLKPYLPYLMLIQVDGPQFRYRLVGTQVAMDMGRDPTGTVFGTHVTTNRFAVELIEQLCRVRDTGTVLFTTGFYRTDEGASHATARLLMPLGEGGNVRMILQARAARYPEAVTRATDWLGTAQGVIVETLEVGAEADMDLPAATWFASSIEKEAPAENYPLLSRRAEGFG